MPTPTWSAARSGLLGDPGAADASSQLNQLLGTHGITPVYQGAPILTPQGSGGTAWQYHLDAYDIAQPFTMSGTTIGRVAVPLLPVGAGADLIVSLCANNSGVPGSVITQTRIPANWISQLAAVSGVAGPSSSAPVIQYTNSPLALAQFNSLHMGPTTTTNWSYPLIVPGFAVVTGAQCYYGDYIIVIGGQGGSTFVSNVFTIAYDAVGNLAQAIPQPAFPVADGGDAANTVVVDPSSGAATIVVAGGNPTSSTVTNAVYTASFDPAKGVISAWTAQAALPQAFEHGNAVAWNGFVYVVGGDTLTVDINTVYYAQVQNQQINTWKTATLPFAMDSPYATAINGFLILAGGSNFAGVPQTTCLYASIHSDGSLGPWQSAPSLPNGTYQLQAASPALGSFGIMAVGNGQMYLLGWGANGPGDAWMTFNAPNGGVLLAEATSAAGAWLHYGLYNSNYVTMPIALTPRISVPLPTTGLSNGATYHILLSQPGGDLNDYLRTHDDLNVFPGNPTMLTRAKGSSAWTAGASGHAIPIQVYDSSALGKVWHLWEDSGARISTLAWGTTPNQPALGILEATAQPGLVLNQWPTFAGGLGPWHATGGAITQSSAQAHGSLPASMLLTPSGSAAQSYAESDLFAVQQGHSYVLTAWYYSPTGYSNVAVSANWFDAGRNYLSTTSGASTSITAGAWTQFATTVTSNVANAVYLDIVCIEGGTPPATALLYVSVATAQDASGQQVSSVVGYDYAATWPNSGMWPPTGLTELA